MTIGHFILDGGSTKFHDKKLGNHSIGGDLFVLYQTILSFSEIATLISGNFMKCLRYWCIILRCDNF